MEKGVAGHLSSVIKANTERRSLEELAAQGKRHVRVVSGQKVLKIIEGIVDEAISRETSSKLRKDRDQIIAETKKQFDQVMRLQSEQEAEARKHRAALEEARNDLEDAKARLKRRTAELNKERMDQAEREAKLIAEYQDSMYALGDDQRQRMAGLENEREALEARIRAEEERAEAEMRRCVGLEADLALAEQQGQANAARLRRELEEERAALETRIRAEEERAEAEMRRCVGLEADLARAEQQGEADVARLRRELEEERDGQAEREAKLISEYQEKLSAIERERSARTEDYENRIQGLSDELRQLLMRFQSEKGEDAARREQVIAEAGEKIRELEQQTDEARRAEAQALARAEEAAAAMDRMDRHLRSSEKARKKHERTIESFAEQLEAERKQNRDLTARLAREKGEIAVEQEKALADERTRVEVLTGQLSTAGTALEAAQEKLEALAAEKEELLARFASEKGELAGRQEEALAEAQRRIEELDEERVRTLERAEFRDEESRKKERALGKLQARLARVRETGESRVREIEQLKERQVELTGLLEASRVELEAVRQESGSQSVEQLQGELKELRNLVGSIADKPGGIDEGALGDLMDRLGEREGNIEDRFGQRMDQTIDEIGRALRVATGKPIDIGLEATDVLVDRIFDRGAEMQTNLGSIEVEEQTSGSGITGSLELLRAVMDMDETGES